MRNCKYHNCNGIMLPGIALEHDSPELRPSMRGVGYFPRSNGRLVSVIKCNHCGYSRNFKSTR